MGITINWTLPRTMLKVYNIEYHSDCLELRQFLEDLTPLGRIGYSKDLAHLADLLCSPKATFISGQAIYGDGGMSLEGQESLARHVAAFDQPKVRQ